jgi:hypothetical protein
VDAGAASRTHHAEKVKTACDSLYRVKRITPVIKAGPDEIEPA